MSAEQVRTFGGWREAKPFGVLGMDGRQTLTALVLLMGSILAGSINFVWLLAGAAATVAYVGIGGAAGARRVDRRRAAPPGVVAVG